MKIRQQNFDIKWNQLSESTNVTDMMQDYLSLLECFVFSSQ